MNAIRTIAVIGAMQPEIELLKGRLNNRESHRFGAFEIHCGELHGKRIVLTLSGIGKVNAAAATATAILKFSPDCVINTAERAAEAFPNAAVRRGLIVSGDRFVHSSEAVAAIRKNFPDVQAVEMEAAAIAQTCAQFGLPFVVIRAVSDAADEKADVSFDEFLQTAAVHSAEMVDGMIREL